MAKAKFNRTNDNIEWSGWSWNPATGCRYGCQYCYARDIAMRFVGNFNPTFHAERLEAPQNTKVPRKADVDVGLKNVFVCSMADLFGPWVPDAWISQVLDQVRANPQWNFLFLTKNPTRLIQFDWPVNAWVGCTVDTQKRVEDAQTAFKGLKASVRFVSCEPMLERLTFSDLSVFDWMIIGGRSRNSKGPEFQPPVEWVEDLTQTAKANGLKLYYKPNLKPQGLAEKERETYHLRYKEYPQTGNGKAQTGLGTFGNGCANVVI